MYQVLLFKFRRHLCKGSMILLNDPSDLWGICRSPGYYNYLPREPQTSPTSGPEVGKPES